MNIHEKARGDRAWRTRFLGDIPKASGIYLIECITSGNRYIGASKNLRLRLYEHLFQMAFGSKRLHLLGEDYERFGKESIKIEVLELVSDKAQLVEREKYWISKIDNLSNIASPVSHWTWQE